MNFNIYTYAMNIINTIMKTIKPKIESKADKTQVLTNVPLNALFTDTIFTSEMAQDAVNTMLQNGSHSNITVSYDDAGNAISLAGSASTTNLTSEQVQDIIGGGIFGGAGISVTYDDVGNKINIALAGVSFTSTLLAKLNAIEAGAEANVQSDWAATDGDAFILNKPNTTEVTNTQAITQAEVDSAYTAA